MMTGRLAWAISPTRPPDSLGRRSRCVHGLRSSVKREERVTRKNGAAAATLVIDQQGRPKAAPVVSLRGMEDEDGELVDAIIAGLKEMLADLSAAERRDDGRIEDAAHKALRRVVRAHLGKKPLTDVHIVRI